MVLYTNIHSTITSTWDSPYSIHGMMQHKHVPKTSLHLIQQMGQTKHFFLIFRKKTTHLKDKWDVGRRPKQFPFLFLFLQFFDVTWQAIIHKNTFGCKLDMKVKNLCILLYFWLPARTYYTNMVVCIGIFQNWVNLGHFFQFKKHFENRLPRLRQLLTIALRKPAAAFWPSRSKVCDPTAARNYAG